VTDQPPPPGAATNRMAVASLVCSLFGWLCIVGPLLGLIFGLVALHQIRETGQRGRGMALAGIMIGGILVALGIVVGIHRQGARHMPHRDSGAPAVVMIVEPQAVSPVLERPRAKVGLVFPVEPGAEVVVRPGEQDVIGLGFVA
jgi:Domain of unknown function (DUF4190)